MAPRAAARLESLGFHKVHEYKPGKLDWLAAGLPTEGTNAARTRAGTVARRDVPVCALHDRLGDVADRVGRAGWQAVVVVDERRVVLGLLRAGELAKDRDLAIEAAMRPAPSTFRPYVSIEEMADYMTKHNLESSPITLLDGTLVGLLFRADAVRAAGAS
ncbi:MAG TPA: CBS domain-containing protein [Candidatus Dormibacteraeota bacterium]|nr:CBS domain-containing protein [Candidatus Dormibacteraeota bacterium]